MGPRRRSIWCAGIDRRDRGACGEPRTSPSDGDRALMNVCLHARSPLSAGDTLERATGQFPRTRSMRSPRLRASCSRRPASLRGLERAHLLRGAAGSYLLWGVGLRVSLKANWSLLEETGTSTRRPLQGCLRLIVQSSCTGDDGRPWLSIVAGPRQRDVELRAWPRCGSPHPVRRRLPRRGRLVSRDRLGAAGLGSGQHHLAARQLNRWSWGMRLILLLLVVAAWDMVFKPGF